MKKVKVMLAVSLLIAIGFSAHADSTIDRLWSSLYVDIPAGLGGDVNNDGIGWWVEVWNVTDSAATAGNTTTTIGWLDGFGYGVDPFQFTATEADSVLLRLYNNANPGLATFKIDSAFQALANLDNLAAPGPNALDVQFDFSSSTWQAVPEPATFLLFGMGGIGAWLVRRKNRMSV